MLNLAVSTLSASANKKDSGGSFSGRYVLSLDFTIPLLRSGYLKSLALFNRSLRIPAVGFSPMIGSG